MKTKLTLSIDEDIVKLAHRQAKDEGTSVSRLFSGFVMAQQQKSFTKAQQVPTVRDMIGIFKKYSIDDSKAGIREAYAKKYLR